MYIYPPMTKWENRDTNELIETILSLRTKGEAKNFLRDLLTEVELLEFGKRWRAAIMLHNKIPYTEIVNETGLSSTTVARISKWLQKGTGGYRTLLKRRASTH